MSSGPVDATISQALGTPRNISQGNPMNELAKVRGFNHLTLAVANLERSLAFYGELLGCTLRARWDSGAYLTAGSLWLCLSNDGNASEAVRADYTHYAFDVAEEGFEALCKRLRAVAPIWKDNQSEGASLYFLDPDGHRLEIHVGSLESRLAEYRSRTGSGVTIY